jgi:DNA-binding XRE family transcriptional regulator
MDQPLLSSRIIAYRAYTGLSRAHFAKRIGVSSRSLTRLEEGQKLAKSTCDPFVAALKKRDVHPGQPLPALGRKKQESQFAKVELPVSIKDEQYALTDLTHRYKVRLEAWQKSYPAKGAVEPILVIAQQLITQQEKSPVTIPCQRQCLIIGMIQGMMLKEGILSITEALEDHNTLYYVS